MAGKRQNDIDMVATKAILLKTLSPILSRKRYTTKPELRVVDVRIQRYI